MRVRRKEYRIWVQYLQIVLHFLFLIRCFLFMDLCFQAWTPENGQIRSVGLVRAGLNSAYRFDVIIKEC